MSDDRDPDLISPGWARPRDWPYEEDHDSPKWKRRLARNDRRVKIGRDKFGFQVCPECEVMHTALTLVCRGCGYRVSVTDAQRDEVDAQLVEEMGDGAEFKPAHVPIIFDPELHKEQPALLLAVRRTAKQLFDALSCYLESGSINAARRAANAMLVGSAFRTRAQFSEMMNMIINNRHPLTEEQLQRARKEAHIGSTDL